VLPPDHVAIHLARRKPGRALIGDCYRVEEDTSKTLTEAGARSGEFLTWHINGERQRHARQHRKATLYNLLRHPRKPKLVGNNFGVWRADFERVNGFDENYCGWGQEDDDLGIRLRRAGVRLSSVLNITRLYHLWHPRDPSATNEWRDGVNVDYFLRRGGLICCRNGMRKRGVAELAIRHVGAPRDPQRVEQIWRDAGLSAPPHVSSNGHAMVEIETLFLPGDGNFSGRAQCNVLVATACARPTQNQLRYAHLIIADEASSWEAPVSTRRFKLADFGPALDSIY
jgi:N-terminal domain of galactosyltransferase